MTIEQTVEIPASHRLTIDVPPEVPAGRAELRLIAPNGAGKWHIPIVSWLFNRREAAQRKAIMEFAGCLKDSPAFAGDPVEIIRRERDAWDAPWGTGEA